MFRQWQDAKRQNPDALLFFRMGDFYELFFDDARQAAPVMQVSLTMRGKGTATEAPMCGVPHHAMSQYLARLIDKGFRVAICEQTEDPKKAKGMVKREVVRVVSPGTVTDLDRLEPGEGNFIAGVDGRPGGPFGIACCDLSTGGLVLAQAETTADLLDLLARHRVREVLLTRDNETLEDVVSAASDLPPICFTYVDAELFRPGTAEQSVKTALRVNSLAGFGCPDDHPALPATAAVLAHLARTQQVQARHLDRLRVEDPGRALVLDRQTRRNLELVANLRDGTKQNTLLEALDRTRTPMGARLLRHWLLEPPVAVHEIQNRHGAVDDLMQRADLRLALCEALAPIRDLERLLSRAALGSAGPRDLAALTRSLEQMPIVAGVLADFETGRLADLLSRMDLLEDLFEHLSSALEDEPSATVGDGRVIKPGFDEELDEARSLASGGRQIIGEIEARERERTGIAKLKIKYNRVFGYSIEITRSNLDRVPDDYQRRQTLANSERFTTPELGELESKILSAEERLAERETTLFSALVQEVTGRAGRIRESAQVIAEIDVLSSFAESAAAEGYVRPSMNTGGETLIEDGRHPVVERLLPTGAFVPNDCLLNDSRRLLVVTGPNMGGKSTYLRQLALIVIMAQAGAFVPARAATISIADRIFCRVGASDNLAGGESTFMVEMTETANILHNATPRSLVLLDEIGRGTATWDGMSIAWAVVEMLHDDPRLKPRGLFATHYHELTQLAATLPGLANVHITVREHGQDVIFLHRVEEGPSDRSYGIHVARLAGVPDRAITRARRILEELTAHGARLSPAPLDRDAPQQASLFDLPALTPAEEEVLDRLRALDTDDLSPRQAHDLLTEIQRLLS